MFLSSKWSLLKKNPPPSSDTTKQMPCSGESTRSRTEKRAKLLSDALSAAEENSDQII